MRIDAVVALSRYDIILANSLENCSCLSDPILSYTCHLLIGNIQAPVACLLHVVQTDDITQ